MKKYLLFFLLFFSAHAFSVEEISIALEKPEVNIQDEKSIRRGAKFFSTVCMACHTMVYMRYNTLAKESGVVYERMPLHVTSWPFGVKPPDLSLEVSRRGIDWVYTYLHSFYADTSRPTGVNNLMVPNTAMSGILVPYQGQQVRLPAEKLHEKIYDKTPRWYDFLVLQAPGSMTPDEFDSTILDVVNFLVYASAPYQIEQQSIGVWVIGFLLILLVLVYLLKKEYWKDIKK